MHFRIHKEGKVYFIILLIVTFISTFISLFLALFFFIVSFYIFYFFRDPIRSVPLDDVIVSPADGIITYIGTSEPPIEINNSQKFIKVSIFLNIFNVHVNRIPTLAVIKNINYIHGKFINASLDKSSVDNERNIMTLEKENKDILIVTQIAGLIARRIVCDVREGQKVNKGTRFGIIKFGSRVDLYLPSTYKTLISLGQSVVGGETIISNPNNILEIADSLEI
jgi:phosphatidylserine decarboxylase